MFKVIHDLPIPLPNASIFLGNADWEIRMYEATKVLGQMRGFDKNFENIVIEKLKTPANNSPMDKAILRTNDIISMKLCIPEFS